jgi:hypothetical protein
VFRADISTTWDPFPQRAILAVMLLSAAASLPRRTLAWRRRPCRETRWRRYRAALGGTTISKLRTCSSGPEPMLKPRIAYGITPLSVACSNGNVAMVRKDVGRGRRPKLGRSYGDTVLTLAPRLGDVGPLTVLLDRAAAANARTRTGTLPARRPPARAGIALSRNRAQWPGIPECNPRRDEPHCCMRLGTARSRRRRCLCQRRPTSIKPKRTP